MPITRNQRHIQTSSPCIPPAETVAATSDKKQDPTHAANATVNERPNSTSGPSETPNDGAGSTQVPRLLRDRRSLATTKPFGNTVPSDYILNRQALKRPASTTPPVKCVAKQPDPTQDAPALKESDQGDQAAASRIRAADKNEGVSILQKPIKQNHQKRVASVSECAGNSSSERLTPQTDGKRNDYTRAKPPHVEAAPIAIEKVIQSVRASLSSQSAIDNRRIDLNDTTGSPDRTKLRPPVRITLPNSSSKRYSLSSSAPSWSSQGSPSETRRIDVINLNSSMLRKNQSSSLSHANQTRDGALNLSASTSVYQQIPKPVDKVFNVLIAVTGSVAAIKLLDLIKKLKSLFPQTYTSKADGKIFKANIRIKIVLTENSKHFLPTKQKIYETLNDLTLEIHDDADEWSQWKKMDDPVLHIELRKWADIMVVAPLDANTMAKISTGICDNLLTCIVRAWDMSKKLLYCPAMNVHMYNHPLTREQLCKLQSLGYLRVDCVEKRLACGDVGMGAMAPVDVIAEKVVENLLRPVSRTAITDQPLLNKQPTYPIMSTNTPSAAQKFISSLNKSFNNIGLNVGGDARNSIVNYSTDRIGAAGVFAQIHAKNYKLPENIVVSSQNNKASKSINGSSHTSGTRTSQHRSGFVTSLQNLQAINNTNNSSTTTSMEANGNGLEDSSESCDDGELISQSTPESCNSEWSYNDFDPTDVLEQSLITDDNASLANNGFPANNSTPFRTNGSSSIQSSNNPRRVDRPPFFNVTEFLNICFDNARDCYTCTICKSDYKNRKSMARHLKEQHIQGNIYHCDQCGMSYKRREKLIKHNRERHGFDGISQ